MITYGLPPAAAAAAAAAADAFGLKLGVPAAAAAALGFERPAAAAAAEMEKRNVLRISRVLNSIFLLLLFSAFSQTLSCYVSGDFQMSTLHSCNLDFFTTKTSEAARVNEFTMQWLNLCLEDSSETRRRRTKKDERKKRNSRSSFGAENPSLLESLQLSNSRRLRLRYNRDETAAPRESNLVSRPQKETFLFFFCPFFRLVAHLELR